MIIKISTASIIRGTFNKNSILVSDIDFDDMFTDAVNQRSSIRCIAMCLLGDTDIYPNTYYDDNTGRCSCRGVCASYDTEPTNTNHVVRYIIGGMSFTNKHNYVKHQ